MAFLDELKKQAELKRQQEQTQTQSKLVAVSQNFLAVQTKYKEMQRYLEELVNQLNVLNPDLRRSYYIDGFGLIDDFRPRDYALSIDSIRIGQKDFINTLLLRFKCVTDKQIKFERDTPQQIDNQKDYFWQNNLKYQCTEFRNERGLVTRAVFTVASEIPVTARFSADFENARITLQVRNLNGFTINEFVYEVNEVTQELLDEFAKFILDKPNRLREIGVHQQARRTLVRPAAQAAKDPPGAAAQEKDANDDGDDGRGKGLLSKLKSLFS
ncbi:hypothetical protein [Thiobacter aerophilum]|uniref:Uncharacterized protein n=1 Tax=Thiobacter aerophilum TaxID=3121275 RepID=A0ABV0EEQ5_9BURK